LARAKARSATLDAMWEAVGDLAAAVLAAAAADAAVAASV
jgi:hypothetical protein